MSNTKLFTALVKAQAEMGKLVKDSQNPHLKNRYASLAAVLDTCRQPLSNNGLVLYQEASTTPDMPQFVIVTSMLVHGESGESVTASLPIPLPQNTAQGIGSAITYGRRYLAMAQCGLAPDDEDDDDGNKASSKAPTQATRQLPAPKPATNGATHRQPAAPPQDESFNAIPNADQSDVLEKARKGFHAECTGAFPKGDTDQARHWLINSYTAKNTPDNVRQSANDLAVTELTELTGNLKKYRKGLAERWAAERESWIAQHPEKAEA